MFCIPPSDAAATTAKQAPATTFPVFGSTCVRKHAQPVSVQAFEGIRAASIGLIDTTQGSVVIGTGMGGVTRQDDGYRDLYDKKLARSHPFTIPRVMYNAAASHISVHDSTFANRFCEGCHRSNLFDEHVVRRSLTCRTCHGTQFALTVTPPPDSS